MIILLLFGTGGIRGIMRKGDFDNDLVVRASKAVASWMLDESLDGIVIAYDTRKNSREFAELTARTVSSYGIETYLFEKPVPTPVLSFAIRSMKLKAGIVITASHNPPEYNGFKVYTHDGVQAIPAYTEKISSFMENPFSPSTQSKIHPVSQEVVKEYIESVVKLIKPYVFIPSKTSLIYSPLHGTGAEFVPPVLRSLGIELVCVESQMHPDPFFSTVKSPNPEEESSFEQIKEYMNKNQISFGISTDPDCDRVGLFAHTKRLTGNQVGVLLAHMLGEGYPPGSYLFKTIVTTDMVNDICDDRKHLVVETPTGFKFIGSEIEKRSNREDFRYFLAFEESCGYLTGDFVRDKDGVIGSALIAAMCTQFDPVERLSYLYSKYGYHVEKLISFQTLSPQDAKRLYEKLSTNPPAKINCFFVEEFYDYSKDAAIPNETLLIKIDGAKVYIRPSGTEPKLKIYIKVKEQNERTAAKKMEELEKGLKKLENLT